MQQLTAQYHAHVYFEPDQITTARQLYKQLAADFPVQLGRIFTIPIGPHPKPMYQVSFTAKSFASLVPWLMHNRQGLDVLIHGVSGDDLLDHTELLMWLGKSHDLDLSVL